MLRMLGRAQANRRMTVVPHTPLRRAAMLAVLTLLGLAAVFSGYLLGQHQSGLDRTYLGLLEEQKRAGEAEVERGSRDYRRQAAESLAVVLREHAEGDRDLPLHL